MSSQATVTAMIEQDRGIEEVVAREGGRLRSFIRRRVADAADVEDVLQDVLFELVRANRMLVPIEFVTGWLFKVTRNRITDLFRKQSPETWADAGGVNESGEPRLIEEILPSPEDGPLALAMRRALLEELDR